MFAHLLPISNLGHCFFFFFLSVHSETEITLCGSCWNSLDWKVISWIIITYFGCLLIGFRRWNQESYHHMNQHVMCRLGQHIDCSMWILYLKGFFGEEWGSKCSGAILAEPLEWLVDRHASRRGTQKLSLWTARNAVAVFSKWGFWKM